MWSNRSDYSVQNKYDQTQVITIKQTNYYKHDQDESEQNKNNLSDQNQSYQKLK